ncbi:DUF2238 domain-containing protein [Candidatus Pristimantibacillus sp. PTI5]|uniref:DUF2238 domain-containing protein n=1 Tax=Candidatus Pristimantibacillus sp. PTI5 TaxID=3400422 RepID=UPI003B02CDE4
MTSKQIKWTSTNLPFARNKHLQLMIIIFILFFGLMAISPTDRSLWYAYNITPTIIILILAFTYKRFRFSNLSYLLMLVFFCLHTYAAHFTYEGTPLDDWLKTTFHTKRSHYDQVVHFAFGFFFAFPFLEILRSKVKLHGIWSYVLPVIVVLGFSAFFEILEMLAALVAGPSGEAKFVGMQGDIFDTQKDMALGLLGGIVSMGILAWIIRKRDHSAAAPD